MALPDAPPGQQSGYYAGLAIEWAVNMEGRPYVWGAAGPNSFDCSGLVHFCYAQADLPGSGGPTQKYNHMWNTYGMLLLGESIPAGTERPGDLIFPTPGHVGICVAPGLFINAPTEGKNVEVDRYGTTYAIRRLCVPCTQERANNLLQGRGISIDPNGIAVTGMDPGQVQAIGIGDVFGAITQLVNMIKAPMEAISKIGKWLSTPGNWLRVGEILVGVVAILFAVYSIENRT